MSMTLTDRLRNMADKICACDSCINAIIQAVRNRDAVIVMRRPKDSKELLKEMNSSY